MVATDDGAGGDDDKIEDNCNGNEATTAAALVSQMGAGEPMQVDVDGNLIPQVDGPTDILLSEDEEDNKMDETEEAAPENTTESAAGGSTSMEQDVDMEENIPTEESAIKEAETSKTAAESSKPISGTQETLAETENIADNPPDNDEIPMDVDPETDEKEDPNSLSVDEAKSTKSELPTVQSSVKTPSKQISLTETKKTQPCVADTKKTDETDQGQENIIKIEEYLSENDKSSALEDLSAEDNITFLSQDESQEAEQPKDETRTEQGTAISASNERTNTEKPKGTVESTISNSASTTAPVATSNAQIRLEAKNEPMEEKFPDLPISSINGVATSLEKEMENPQKKLTPMKIDIKNELPTSKRENFKQNKMNDSRSETGDDSTALTTLATAALGTAEPPVKVKTEQVI